MATRAPSRPGNLLRWKAVYSEAELCRAAVRVYTKPLFQWRKALSTSTDGKTLYDFAARGLHGLDSLHRSLERQDFHFRPAVALDYNFNGRHRTLYVSPWEERIVDLMLYRSLNRRLHQWFSPIHTPTEIRAIAWTSASQRWRQQFGPQQGRCT